MVEFVSKKLLVAKFNELASKYIDGDKRQRGLAYATAADMIALADAADVQPVKHGRWENEYLEDDDVWWADCTNCKNDSHSRYGRVSIYAYCPNCGARMIKDGEHND